MFQGLAGFLDLRQRLALAWIVVVTSSQNKLSPSQQVFNRLTKADPTALKFQDGDFSTMRDLWAVHKWDSHKMGKNETANVVELFNKTWQEKEPSQELLPIQGAQMQSSGFREDITPCLIHGSLIWLLVIRQSRMRLRHG